MKALVVEDEFVSRAKLQKILSTFGDCHVAVNGNEAINAFRAALDSNAPYDLICLDILMPEMDGHETLKLIRKIEQEKEIDGLDHVKIMMVSALKDASNILKAFKGQCEAYLPKPITRDEVVAKLQKLKLVD